MFRTARRAGRTLVVDLYTEFHRVAAVADIRRFPEDLATERGGLAYFGTSSTARELVESGALHDGAVVWSLWDGYLDQQSGAALRRLLEEAEIPLVLHHTSGHAYIEDLQRIVEGFESARVVPMHSEATHHFVDHFPRAQRHRQLAELLDVSVIEFIRPGDVG